MAKTKETIQRVTSLGGIAKAAKIRAYYKPKPCEYCNTGIKLATNQKIGDVRKKRFCNKSCATKYNNARRTPKVPVPVICKNCEQPFYGIADRTYCDGCLEQARTDYGNRTKGQVSRRDVARHAVSQLNGTVSECHKCGYNLYVEVCHIKAVSEFSDNATLNEINDPNNLIYLCPNCHKEMDVGLWAITGFLTAEPKRIPPHHHRREPAKSP